MESRRKIAEILDGQRRRKKALADGYYKALDPAQPINDRESRLLILGMHMGEGMGLETALCHIDPKHRFWKED